MLNWLNYNKKKLPETDDESKERIIFFVCYQRSRAATISSEFQIQKKNEPKQ